eukprot:TRINITY_DN9937_c0_g1_i1.p1 TRINITY_DN9937_c0_g1~~TRINITY_DN9937_c0_g1_i1.p1  ORF type:complete len:523 (+),score=52.78 TRINITY_DN9937_c0_g1_i1:28-1596(+)
MSSLQLVRVGDNEIRCFAPAKSRPDDCTLACPSCSSAVAVPSRTGKVTCNCGCVITGFQVGCPKCQRTLALSLLQYSKSHCPHCQHALFPSALDISAVTTPIVFEPSTSHDPMTDLPFVVMGSSIKKLFGLPVDIAVLYFGSVRELPSKGLSGKQKHRYCLVSPFHVYICRLNGEVVRCFALGDIKSMWLSSTGPGHKGYIAFSIPSEWDLLLACKSYEHLHCVIATITSRVEFKATRWIPPSELDESITQLNFVPNPSCEPKVAPLPSKQGYLARLLEQPPSVASGSTDTPTVATAVQRIEPASNFREIFDTSPESKESEQTIERPSRNLQLQAPPPLSPLPHSDPPTPVSTSSSGSRTTASSIPSGDANDAPDQLTEYMNSQLQTLRLEGTISEHRAQQALRLARARYLESGNDPRRLTRAQQETFRAIFRAVLQEHEEMRESRHLLATIIPSPLVYCSPTALPHMMQPPPKEVKAKSPVFRLTRSLQRATVHRVWDDNLSDSGFVEAYSTSSESDPCSD